MELTEATNSELNSILSNFDVNTSKFTYEKINTGYINDSYFISVDNQKKYFELLTWTSERSSINKHKIQIFF